MKKTKIDNAFPDSREGQFWSQYAQAWRPLFGKFDSLGFSFEWHEFKSTTPIEWSKSFHPQSLEICLNLSGSGTVETDSQKLQLSPRSFGFYAIQQSSSPANHNLRASRQSGQEHRFLTVELSNQFLSQHLNNSLDNLHPIVKGIINGSQNEERLSRSERLSTRHQKLLESLKTPPVFAGAQEVWYRSKALEVISELLFVSPGGNDKTLFCIRQQKIAVERIEKVKAILEGNLAEPLSLEELGKQVGCSHYYLSRTFSKEVGMTISQYLRQIRIEKAAELLKTGKFNVTEAALEVGYNSLSHFSHAFQKQIGCCPGLYPVKKT